LPGNSAASPPGAVDSAVVALVPAASAVATGATKTQRASTAANTIPALARDAAQQFESLLLEQILRSARESGSG